LLLLLGASALAAESPPAAQSNPGPASEPLVLEAKIPLGAFGDIRGRIDHLAVDVGRRRLFVAELGNDSLGVIDLGKGRVIRTLAELHEPQGIGYVASTDMLYVANARDGSVRLFHGANLSAAGELALGEDSDNVRVDDQAHQVLVGYGTGALAIIDTHTNAKIADVLLQAHPESFRLDPGGNRIFVNVPDTHEIAVVDRVTNKQVASWQTNGLRWNFPMALDEDGHLLTVFRLPAKLGVFRAADGHLITSVPTCRDSDDLFVDARRHRVYVSCGEGFIDVFSAQGEQYVRTAHVATLSGARTALFVPETDRLYLAVREVGETPASVWVFRPVD
jgi:DNA-binding beta-propeller fold protein YncE